MTFRTIFQKLPQEKILLTQKLCLQVQAIYPACNVSFTAAAAEPLAVQPSAGVRQFCQQLTALADAGGSRSAERNDRFAGEVIDGNKAAHGPCGDAPPDGVADEHGVVIVPAVHIGAFQSHSTKVLVVVFTGNAAVIVRPSQVIQSIPSPKAEPFKAWLAMVGKERIEETIDPEQAIDRALDTYLKKGYSEEWIHQRLLAIRIRNELTDEWKKRGVQKGKEYAILTDEISRAWSGMTTGQYKRLKGLTKENLRDNMTDLELVLTMLAEASTTDISKTAKPQTFEENKQVAKRGGKVAGIARQALEAETGKPVITEKNAFDFQQLVTDIVEDAAELPENPTEKKDKD